MPDVQAAGLHVHRAGIVEPHPGERRHSRTRRLGDHPACQVVECGHPARVDLPAVVALDVQQPRVVDRVGRVVEHAPAAQDQAAATVDGDRPRTQELGAPGVHVERRAPRNRQRRAALDVPPAPRATRPRQRHVARAAQGA